MDEWHEAIALRLALWEVRRMQTPLWISWRTIVSEMYEQNCMIFGCSRIVDVRIPPRLMRAPMSELTCLELIQFQANLEHALSVEFQV